MITHRLIPSAAAILAVTVALAACGGSHPAPSATPVSHPSTSTARPTSDPLPPVPTTSAGSSSTTSGDGGAPLADGSTTLDDGTIVLSDGTTLMPDGTLVAPDGAVWAPSEQSDSGTVTDSGTINEDPDPAGLGDSYPGTTQPDPPVRRPPAAGCNSPLDCYDPG